MVPRPYGDHDGVMNENADPTNGPDAGQTTGTLPPPPPGPGDQLRNLQTFRRSSTDRYIAGVAGGLGRHFNVDPTIIRVLLVVLCFFGGSGLIVYGACWLLVPEDNHDSAPIELGSDKRRIALIAVGVVGVCLVLGDTWAGWEGGWVLGIIALVAAIALLGSNRPKNTGQQAPAYQQQQPGQPVQQGAGYEQTAVLPQSYAPSNVPPYGLPPDLAAYIPPPKPRKTGLVLFWPTLALIAIGMGVLAIIDTNNELAAGAYPALALGIVGVMLLVGAFVGRPGGLILLGVISVLGLSVTSVIGNNLDTSSDDVTIRPLTASEVAREYSTSLGRIELDLTDVSDVAALNGRAVDIKLNAGEIVVRVPRSIDVNVDAEQTLAGEIELNNDSVGHDGLNPSVDTTLRGTTTDGKPLPLLNLDLTSRVGHIQVIQE